MANNYIGRARAFNDRDFRMTVAFCVRNAGHLISIDGVSDGPRRALADAVLQESFLAGDYKTNEVNQAFAFAILDNVTIAGTLIDGNGQYDLSGTNAADFEYQVSASWDEIAGRFSSEPEP